MRHTGLPSDSWVSVDLQVRPEVVRVEVSDPGRGFDPAIRPAGGGECGSGWGLHLVDQIAGRWGVVHDAFTRVWFELPRPVAPAPV